MIEEAYECKQCRLKFLFTPETTGCPPTPNDPTKCPRCGSEDVLVMPFKPEMLLDIVALNRSGFNLSGSG